MCCLACRAPLSASLWLLSRSGGEAAATGAAPPPAGANDVETRISPPKREFCSLNHFSGSSGVLTHGQRLRQSCLPPPAPQHTAHANAPQVQEEPPAAHDRLAVRVRRLFAKSAHARGHSVLSDAEHQHLDPRRRRLQAPELLHRERPLQLPVVSAPLGFVEEPAAPRQSDCRMRWRRFLAAVRSLRRSRSPWLRLALPLGSARLRRLLVQRCEHAQLSYHWQWDCDSSAATARTDRTRGDGDLQRPNAQGADRKRPQRVVEQVAAAHALRGPRAACSRKVPFALRTVALRSTTVAESVVFVVGGEKRRVQRAAALRRSQFVFAVERRASCYSVRRANCYGSSVALFLLLELIIRGVKAAVRVRVAVVVVHQAPKIRG